jgi:hypothetical protein
LGAGFAAAPATGSHLTTPLSPHISPQLQPYPAAHTQMLQPPIKPRVRRKSSGRAHSRKGSLSHTPNAADAADSDAAPGDQLIQALEMHMVSHGVDQAVLQEQERLRRLVEQHNRRVAAMQQPPQQW